MDKKYVIFDMDGTLLDSMPFWKNLSVEYLTEHGITEPMEPIIQQVATMTLSEASEFFVNRFSLPHTPAQIVEFMTQRIRQHYQQDIMLKKNVLSYLKELKQRGVAMCVASATAEDLMLSALTRLEILPYFEFILSCETIKVSKQHPDIYFMAAQRLGAQPHEIAVFEDARYAVETAKKAGFYVVGVKDEAEAKEWDAITNIVDECIDFDK